MIDGQEYPKGHELFQTMLRSGACLENIYLFDMLKKDFEKGRIVYFVDNGAEIPGQYFASTEYFELLSLSNKRNIIVLDNKHCQHMIQQGEVSYPVVPCVQFDIQVITYMRNMYCGKWTQETDKAFNAMQYILEKQMDYSCALYLMENCMKLGNRGIYENTYDSLRYYSRFREYGLNFTIGEDDMKKDPNIILGADQMFSTFSLLSRQDVWRDFEEVYGYIYALLLKAIILEWEEKSTKGKTVKLLEFIYQDLGLMLERECAVVYLYFKKKLPRFFKDIQKNNPKILGKIKSMAWDLLHLDLLEYSMQSDCWRDVPYTHPILLTFDRGLAEVAKNYPVKAIGFHENRMYRVYEQELYELISEADIIEYYIPPEKRKPKNKKMMIRDLEAAIKEKCSLE